MQNTEKEIAMYGEPKEWVLADYARQKKLLQDHSYIYIMGILSDAQQVIEMGQLDTARQFINKAKLLISEKGKEND